MSEEEDLMPVPEDPSAEVAFIRRPVLSGVVSRSTVNASFDAIVVCRQAMLDYILNADLPGHSLSSPEYKKLTQKFTALCAVASVDAQAEIKSFDYLAKVGRWYEKPKAAEKKRLAERDASEMPDGVGELIDD